MSKISANHATREVDILNVYGHVTEKMKRDSADRMAAFIKDLKKSGKKTRKG